MDKEINHIIISVRNSGSEILVAMPTKPKICNQKSASCNTLKSIQARLMELGMLIKGSEEITHNSQTELVVAMATKPKSGSYKSLKSIQARFMELCMLKPCMLKEGLKQIVHSVLFFL